MKYGVKWKTGLGEERAEGGQWLQNTGALSKKKARLGVAKDGAGGKKVQKHKGVFGRMRVNSGWEKKETGEHT